MNVEYDGPERVYIVDDGETWAYVATSPDAAVALHLAATEPETPPDEWEVTEIPPGEERRVGGDVSERDVPAGGRWEPDGRYPGSGETVATAAQYAAHHRGHQYAIWSSVY